MYRWNKHPHGPYTVPRLGDRRGVESVELASAVYSLYTITYIYMYHYLASITCILNPQIFHYLNEAE